MSTTVERTTGANFCRSCGGPLQYRVPDFDTRARPVCTRCGEVVYGGPALLVTVVVAAQDSLLLIKRGTRPYINKWAPPGGFVEAGESLENAAVRELREEAGLELRRDQLELHGMISLPAINQIYATFFAFLEQRSPLKAAPPETLDARWFSESEFPAREIWDPARDIDVARFFDCIRERCLQRWQSTLDVSRMINGGKCIAH